MWAIQRHFVSDNRFEFAARIPNEPAITPKTDPYNPGKGYKDSHK